MYICACCAASPTKYTFVVIYRRRSNPSDVQMSGSEYTCTELQVLIEFPCELVSAVVAGRWAASSSPFKPFLFGYQARVIMAGVVTTIVRPTSGSQAATKSESTSWQLRC